MESGGGGGEREREGGGEQTERKRSKEREKEKGRGWGRGREEGVEGGVGFCLCLQYHPKRKFDIHLACIGCFTMTIKFKDEHTLDAYPKAEWGSKTSADTKKAVILQSTCQYNRYRCV